VSAKVLPWVVVSGVTSGIGLATARLLLEKGYAVAGLGRRKDALGALRAELGARFAPIEVDFAERMSLERGILELGALSGEVAAVVSNAAECVYQTLLDLPLERLDRLLTVNVRGPVALAQALVPRLGEGGVFIQVSSVTARFLPGAKFAAYSATKAAMDTMVEGLRLELGPRKIRVSTITPGLVDTAIYDKVEGFAGARRKLEAQIPEWLRPEDVARAVLFILEQPAHVAIPDLVITPTLQVR
jgi:NADP-dependent 3-hydroxy acid dehydrogenase YdfG